MHIYTYTSWKVENKPSWAEWQQVGHMISLVNIFHMPQAWCTPKCLWPTAAESFPQNHRDWSMQQMEYQKSKGQQQCLSIASISDLGLILSKLPKWISTKKISWKIHQNALFMLIDRYKISCPPLQTPFLSVPIQDTARSVPEPNQGKQVKAVTTWWTIH